MELNHFKSLEKSPGNLKRFFKFFKFRVVSQIHLSTIKLCGAFFKDILKFLISSSIKKTIYYLNNIRKRYYLCVAPATLPLPYELPD